MTRTRNSGDEGCLRLSAGSALAAACIVALATTACSSSPKKASDAGSTDGAKDVGSDGPTEAVGPDVGSGVDTAAGGSSGADGGSAGAGGAGTMTATLFINDSANGLVYRYNVTPTTDPVLTAMISAPPAASGMAVSAAGELFVGQDTDAGDILRFKSILGTPTPNGMTGHPDGHHLLSLAFVDDELWGMSSAFRACNTNPSNIVRLAFDATGAATPAGTITTGLVGANRSILWDPTLRVLFVTQCEQQRAIQRYQVAADHTVTALTPITGDPLNNPHAMVMTAWRELIVANAGVAAAPSMSLQRFKVDEHANLTPNGTIDGNGLNLPVGVGLAPWGELFAVSNATAVISRFTFDAAHVPTAHGTFQMTAPTTAQSLGVGWVLIVPGASTNLVPTLDAGADGAADGG